MGAYVWPVSLQNGPQESPHLCSHPRGENQYKKTSLANRQAGEKANILSLLIQAAPKNCLSIMM